MFADRQQAGQVLATLLAKYAPDRPLVLGLPRGGVPVAKEIADALHAELDVFLVRKLGLPSHRELAMGAVASGGVRVLNDHVIARGRVSERTIDEVTREERAELDRRERAYRGDRPALDLRDRVVILVDDGVATGASMRAAVLAARQMHARKVVVAVPVAAAEAVVDLGKDADDVVAADTPRYFQAVGLHYGDFHQVSDREVTALLRA